MGQDEKIGRILTWVLGLCAAASVLAILSTWGVGWISDDWRLLERAWEVSFFLPEENHVSAYLAFVWWSGGVLDSPVPARALALLCHGIALLGVLPRIVRALFPDWDPRAGLWVALGALCLSSCAEPLVWACTSGYAGVGSCLLFAVYAHLRWLEDPSPRWRLAGVGAAFAGLLVLEYGILAAPLLALVSWSRERSLTRCARDVWPYLLLLVPYGLLKLGLESTVVLQPREPLRIAGNVGYTPFLALSPWLFHRDTLVALPGVAMAGGTLLGLAALLIRGRRRTPLALLLMGYVVLLPVIYGPGPEQRYLYLAAPWLLLGTVAAAHAAGVTAKRRLALALVCAWAISSVFSLWRFAGHWREAGRVECAVLDALVEAAGEPPRAVVVLNAPDRLPDWGPTHKYWLFRVGLREALARRGVDLVVQAHFGEPDPELLGLQVNTPRATLGAIEAWQSAGYLVLDCAPAPIERVVVWERR